MSGANRGGRTSREEMLRVDAALLDLVGSRTARTDAAVELSLREIGAELGVTRFRAASALRRLQAAGLLEVAQRFDETGAQRPNAVALTGAGVALLDAFVRAAGQLLGDVYRAG